MFKLLCHLLLIQLNFSPPCTLADKRVHGGRVPSACVNIFVRKCLHTASRIRLGLGLVGLGFRVRVSVS